MDPRPFFGMSMWTLFPFSRSKNCRLTCYYRQCSNGASAFRIVGIQRGILQCSVLGATSTGIGISSIYLIYSSCLRFFIFFISLIV